MAKTARDMESLVDAVLDASRTVQVVPGYVSGDEVGEWRIQVGTALNKALADLADHMGYPALGESLRLATTRPCGYVLSTSREEFSYCLERKLVEVETGRDNLFHCAEHAEIVEAEYRAKTVQWLISLGYLQVNAEAMVFRCGCCDALPGEPCSTSTGRPTSPHAARLRKAQEEAVEQR